ncbi:carbohydrate ABC transporter permease [Ruania suaedae]|uniref:carbohydrate ABC transporter permease n=1 Tax=Ruania suaedae TaxID=2897774 RepID=UPI001E652117|nr:carbohydrate ABC transporter permease [Ruania suaedae]UFU03713.1 carbohydrate ABC transporter permease [Ruania suaedae]
MTLLYGVPLFWIVLTSFKGSDEVFGPAFSFSPTLDAYRDMIGPQLWSSLQQSVAIAVGTTAFVLLIAVPAAYAVARVSGWVSMIGLGLLIVFQMSPQTANVIPLFQIFGEWRMLDSTAGVIVADTALLTPFAVMLLRPFFRAVPPQLEEAAAIDGAGVMRIFATVVLPIARNGVFTVGTLVFLLSWGEFLYAVNFYLSPGQYPLSALLAQQVSAFGINWPGLMALSVLTSIPILIVYLLAYGQLRDGLAAGSVK